MQITTQYVPIYDIEADAIVMVVFSDKKPAGELAELDGKMNGKISQLIEVGEISGKYREFTLIHSENLKAPRILLMGLGKEEEFEVDKIRSMSGRAARILRRIKCKKLAYSSFTGLDVPPEISAKCIAEGVILGLYHFKKYVTTRSKASPVEDIIVIAKKEEDVDSLEKGIAKGIILAEATNMARDLVNEPGNIMTPTYFAERATEVSKEFGMEIEVLEKEDMKKKGMGALLAVAQGSEEPPKMVVMKYKGGKEGSPTLSLVGKGITFDAGGLDLKPADSMYRMYGDCSGACAVLGTMKALAGMKVPMNVTAVMPLTENMPSGTAYRPGDVITSYSGKTIEILNTDAEGRLALADALTLAQEVGADYIIDIATLTGGCVVALGVTASGVMTNNKELKDQVIKAGEIAAEKMWELPLFEEYFAQIHSDVADMENSGGRNASACTAGLFLKQFINNDTPWVHIDIAGTAMIERERTPYLKKPYLPKEGGTGVGVRTMFHLAEMLAEK